MNQELGSNLPIRSPRPCTAPNQGCTFSLPHHHGFIHHRNNTSPLQHWYITTISGQYWSPHTAPPQIWTIVVTLYEFSNTWWHYRCNTSPQNTYHRNVENAYMTIMWTILIHWNARCIVHITTMWTMHSTKMETIHIATIWTFISSPQYEYISYHHNMDIYLIITLWIYISAP